MNELIKIDGVEYNIKSITQEINIKLQSLQFVNEQILQRQNDLQVLDTARLSYIAAFKQELELKNWKK